MTGDNPGLHGVHDVDRTNPGYLTYDYCWAQCWYDNFVVSPAGQPGHGLRRRLAYNYDFPPRNNGRAVLLSTDAGDALVRPDARQRRPTARRTGSTPTSTRSSSTPRTRCSSSKAQTAASSARAAARRRRGRLRQPRPRPARRVTRRATTSLPQIPTKIDDDQRRSLDAAVPGSRDRRTRRILGGTQDNGTWRGTAGASDWNQTIYGDGGVAAFDVSKFVVPDERVLRRGHRRELRERCPDGWVIVVGTFCFHSGESSAFYKPQISDPVVSGHVLRRPAERLADAGLRRRPDDASRRTAPSSRPSPTRPAAATSRRSAIRRATVGRIARAT